MKHSHDVFVYGMSNCVAMNNLVGNGKAEFHIGIYVQTQTLVLITVCTYSLLNKILVRIFFMVAILKFTTNIWSHLVSFKHRQLLKIEMKTENVT